MRYSLVIICNFFIWSHLVKISKSTDCDLIQEFTRRNDTIFVKYFEHNSNTASLKCGIIPANLINNKNSNAIFLIERILNTNKNSIRLRFFLDDVEDYSHLNYYYSLRTFKKNEFFTNAKSFKFKKNENISKNNDLILNIKHQSKYTLVQDFFIVCIIIMNLKNGIMFNLPFMCMDIMTKNEYLYERIETKRSIFVLISLIPLLFILILFISISSRLKNKHKHKNMYMTTSLVNKFRNYYLYNENMSNIQMVSRLSTSYDLEQLDKISREIINKELKIPSEYNDSSVYSQYELIKNNICNMDQKKTIINDLILKLEQSSSCSRLSSESSNFNEIEKSSSNSTSHSKLNLKFFYLNHGYLNTDYDENEFAEYYV